MIIEARWWKYEKRLEFRSFPNTYLSMGHYSPAEFASKIDRELVRSAADVMLVPEWNRLLSWNVLPDFVWRLGNPVTERGHGVQPADCSKTKLIRAIV